MALHRIIAGCFSQPPIAGEMDIDYSPVLNQDGQAHVDQNYGDAHDQLQTFDSSSQDGHPPIDENDEPELVDPEQALLNQLFQDLAPFVNPVVADNEHELSETDSGLEEKETNLPSNPVQPIGLPTQDADERVGDWLNGSEIVSDSVLLPTQEEEANGGSTEGSSADRGHEISPMSLDEDGGHDHGNGHYYYCSIYHVRSVIGNMNMDNSSLGSLEE